MSSNSPPVPFADFQFSFDPSISDFFPPPPQIPLPSSADLFSQSETTDLLGFLDNFNWEFDADPVLNAYPQSRKKMQQQEQQAHALQSSPPPGGLPPYQNRHTTTSPEPSTSIAGGRVTRSASSPTKPKYASKTEDKHSKSKVPRTRRSIFSSSSPSPNNATPPSSAPTQARTKSLLSSPQKRLNHIMSEQKRRNAIRDGYAQLISLLAPAGAPGIGMPTRGRPKGSGSRGKGKMKTKGKSGVLFRAVEYVKWLEEGRDALFEEVLRAEAAAGIRHH